MNDISGLHKKPVGSREFQSGGDQAGGMVTAQKGPKKYTQVQSPSNQSNFSDLEKDAAKFRGNNPKKRISRQAEATTNDNGGEEPSPTRSGKRQRRRKGESRDRK